MRTASGSSFSTLPTFGSGRTIRLTFDGVPPPQLSSNMRRKTHYHTLSRLTKVMKAAATELVELRVGSSRANPYYPQDTDVDVWIRVNWPKGRNHWDADSLASGTKALLDGLTLGGLWHDDRQIANVSYSSTMRGEMPGSINILIKPKAAKSVWD